MRFFFEGRSPLTQKSAAPKGRACLTGDSKGTLSLWPPEAFFLL